MKHKSKGWSGWLFPMRGSRDNPTLSEGQVVMRGLGAALVAVGANRTLDTVVDPFLRTDRTRSLVKSGIALLLGYGMRKSYPFLAAGIAGAGALEVAQLAYREFGMERYEAMARSRVAMMASGLRPAAAVTTPSETPGQTTNGVTGALGEGLKYSPGIPGNVIPILESQEPTCSWERLATAWRMATRLERLLASGSISKERFIIEAEGLVKAFGDCGLLLLDGRLVIRFGGAPLPSEIRVLGTAKDTGALGLKQQFVSA